MIRVAATQATVCKERDESSSNKNERHFTEWIGGEGTHGLGHAARHRWRLVAIGLKLGTGLTHPVSATRKLSDFSARQRRAHASGDDTLGSMW